MARAVAKISIGGANVPEFFGSLLEMEVEQDHRMAAVFRIRLAVRKRPDGSWTFLDGNRVKLWDAVKISVSVDNRSEELISGYVTEIKPRIGRVETDSTLEIKGMDASCLMNLEEKLVAWPGKKDSDIARAVFRSYVRSAVVDATDVAYTEESGVVMQRETDIQFLKRLARRNGFECFVAGGRGYFRKPVLNSPRLPTLAAHFGRQTNLVSFEARADATRPAQVRMSQIDTLAKEVQQAAATRTTQSQLGRRGAGALRAPGGHKPLMFVRGAVALNKAQMENLSQALYDEAEWFVEAGGVVETSAYGAVLGVRRLVPVKGVGEMFSGVYYLTSVRHVFAGDRYTQHFTARRNALAAQSAADFSGLSTLSVGSAVASVTRLIGGSR